MMWKQDGKLKNIKIKMVESISELRKICQKQVPDPDFRRRVTRYFSIYLTKLLLYTPITANQVSFLTIIISIMSGFFFALGNYSYSLIGIFLMQLALILDANDGEIARYRKSASLNGQFVDIVSHSIAIPAALMGITIAFSDSLMYLILGLFSITFVFLSSTVSIFKHEIIFHMLMTYAKKEKSYLSSKNSKLHETKFIESSFKQFFKSILLLFKYPYSMYTLSILVVFNKTEWILIILGIASPILWIIYSYKEFKLGIEPYEHLFEPYK